MIFLVCRSFFRVFFRTIMGRRDELIPADQAARTRDIVKSLDEPLVYPESRQELEKAIQEHSLGHNPQVYPEQPSCRKDIPEFSVVQGNGGKTTEGGEQEMASSGGEVRDGVSQYTDNTPTGESRSRNEESTSRDFDAELRDLYRRGLRCQRRR